MVEFGILIVDMMEFYLTQVIKVLCIATITIKLGKMVNHKDFIYLAFPFLFSIASQPFIYSKLHCRLAFPRYPEIETKKKNEFVWLFFVFESC